MISVVRLDGKSMMLNADWIQSVEATPDTLITLTNGSKIIVQDSLDEVIAAFKAYKREVVVDLKREVKS